MAILNQPNQHHSLYPVTTNNEFKFLIKTHEMINTLKESLFNACKIYVRMYLKVNEN